MNGATDLELRIKLWDHLATKGNLVSSAAWYETEAQAEFWHKMSESSVTQEGTNDYKEVELIRQLAGRKEFSKYKDDDLVVVDLGSGTGVKAAELLDALPPARIIYVPVDNSPTFIRQTWKSVHLKGLTDFTTLQTGCRTEHIKDLNEYLEGVDTCDYKRAFRYTLKYWDKYHELFNFKDQAELQPFFEQHPEVRPLLMRGAKKLAEAFQAFYDRVDKLSRGIYSRDEARKHAAALHLELDPESMAEIADIFTEQSYNFCVFSFDQMRRKEGETPDINVPETDVPELLEVLEQFDKDSFNGLARMRRSESLQYGVKYVHAFGAGLRTDLVAGNLDDLGSVINETRRIRPYSKYLIGLLGQTLGNFDVNERDSIIRMVAHTMNKGDSLLIGAELAPDESSPNYAQKAAKIRYRYGGKITSEMAARLGVSTTQDDTADKFLRHTTGLIGINDADIAFDNEYENNTIKMFYRVTNPEGIRVLHPERTDESLFLPFGKKIMTAVSYKFTIPELHKLVQRHGLNVIETPDRDGYTVVFAQK